MKRPILLKALDENAALDGPRPLEQIADWNPIGWCGVIYQMSVYRSRMHVLEQWPGACSASQQAYHNTAGELFVQRQTRREARRVVGRLPTLCWCDNKSGVGQSLKGALTDVDVRHQR